MPGGNFTPMPIMPLGAAVSNMSGGFLGLAVFALAAGSAWIGYRRGRHAAANHPMANAAPARDDESCVREVADAMTSIAWIGAPDGSTTYQNDKCRQFTGMSGADALARWSSVLHPDDLQKCLDRWSAAVRSGQPYENDYRLREGKTGNYVWHRAHALPVRDKAGEIVRWFGTATNIDAALRTEQALRDNEARFSAVVDSAAEGIITINEQGAIEYVNAAAASSFGYDFPGEMLGKSLGILMAPSHRPEHDTFLSDYLRTGRRKIIGIGREVIGLRKDGTEFPLDLSVSEVRLGERRVFTGILRDITRRKESEKRLRDSHALLHALIEGITDPVYVKDEQGRYLLANTALAESSGARRTLSWAIMTPKFTDPKRALSPVRPMIGLSQPAAPKPMRRRSTAHSIRCSTSSPRPPMSMAKAKWRASWEFPATSLRANAWKPPCEAASGIFGKCSTAFRSW